MPARPVCRYYNFGLTFRWVRGDSFVAVKRGYVIEGQSVVVVRESKTPRVNDRPNEAVGTDEHTWVAKIPVNAADWNKPNSLASIATSWARKNTNLADWRDQPRRPPSSIRERG